MKECRMYKCEICGKKSENSNEIIECECSHLGITLEEKKEWERLKRVVEHCSFIVSRTKNEETELSYDEAIEALIQFEKNHNIVLNN